VRGRGVLRARRAGRTLKINGPNRPIAAFRLSSKVQNSQIPKFALAHSELEYLDVRLTGFIYDRLSVRSTTVTSATLDFGKCKRKSS